MQMYILVPQTKQGN